MEGTPVDTTMRNATSKLGLEDYALFPDDGKRHELIDGEHIVTPAPTSRHQRLVIRLGVAIYQHAEANRLGVLLPAPTDVVLSRHDVVQPDLLFVVAARLAIIHDRVDGPPDLAIEVLSPSSRRTDEVLKRRAYERTGVAELWIVDPDVERVRIYRREQGDRGGSFARARELAAEHDEALETELLLGFTMRLADLFSDPLLDGR
jgi:Uma2 family endonuclease